MKNIFVSLTGGALILFGIFILGSFSNIVKNTDHKTLSGAYNDFFPVGAAVNPSIISSEDTVLLLSQFNTITADNAMKPVSLHPAENVWNWTKADKLVEFANRNGLKMRGHCLLWHQQTPDWFFLDGKETASKELVLKRLKDHIFTVMEHFKGTVYCWDVVNEAVDDDPARVYREKDSKWFQITGEEYIAKAFEYAHEADPNAILFYNDYNCERPEKRERIYQVLKKLIDQGVPVHGMGLQGHWSIYEPAENELRSAIERFSSLGLQIQITELDISVYKWEKEQRKRVEGEIYSYTPEQQKLQNEKYEMIFRVFRDYPGAITGITFWGVADNHTWLDNYPVKGRKNFPLLFDQNLKPKEAFYKVVNF